MKHNPLVSILIPFYNAQAYIADTIERCLDQSYKDIEIIIVDDHSTDNSLSVAQQFECNNIHIYQNPKKGGNSARNYAFQMSKGEYVKFLDADDYFSSEMLKKQVERLMKDGTDNSVVFSPVRMLYEDGHWLNPPRSIDFDHEPAIELLLDIWRGKGWHCPHCHLMHRNLVEKAGLWDENVIKNQDGEFFARVYAVADKALSVPDEYAVWRQFNTGVHAVMKLNAIKSALYTKQTIGNLILAYKNNTETRTMIGRSIGFFVYENWPQIKPLLQDIQYICSKLNVNMVLPERKKLKILTLLFGWQKALDIIKK